MTEHTEENIGDDDIPIFTTNLNHLIDRGYPRGYADGLNAAREAIENLMREYQQASGSRQPDEDYANALADALIGIDALRKDPNEVEV